MSMPDSGWGPAAPRPASLCPGERGGPGGGCAPPQVALRTRPSRTRRPAAQRPGPAQTCRWALRGGRAGALEPTPARSRGPHGPAGKARGPLGLSGEAPPYPARALDPRAPTSAQVLPPRQQRQQQVATRRLPAGAQLPARLHGPAARCRRNPGPARPRPQWPRADVRAAPRAAGRCARGPPGGPSLGRGEGGAPGGGAAGRGGAGSVETGRRLCCVPLRRDPRCPDATECRPEGAGGRAGGAGLALPAPRASSPCAAGRGLGSARGPGPWEEGQGGAGSCGR